MNINRLSKKSPHVDHRQTLVAIHEEKMKEFHKDYSEIPSKKKRLGLLMEQYKNGNCENKWELYEKITQLQKELKKLLSQEKEFDYLFKASPFLLKYNTEVKKNKKEKESDKKEEFVKDLTPLSNTISNFVLHKNTSNRGKLCKDYQQACFNTIECKSNSEYFRDELIKLLCKECNQIREIYHNEAMASCSSCGSQVPYQDMFQHQEHREEVEMMSPFALSLALKSTPHYTSKHCIMKTGKIFGIFILILC